MQHTPPHPLGSGLPPLRRAGTTRDDPSGSSPPGYLSLPLRSYPLVPYDAILGVLMGNMLGSQPSHNTSWLTRHHYLALARSLGMVSDIIGPHPKDLTTALGMGFYPILGARSAKSTLAVGSAKQ